MRLATATCGFEMDFGTTFGTAFDATLVAAELGRVLHAAAALGRFFKAGFFAIAWCKGGGAKNRADNKLCKETNAVRNSTDYGPCMHNIRNVVLAHHRATSLIIFIPHGLRDCSRALSSRCALKARRGPPHIS